MRAFLLVSALALAACSSGERRGDLYRDGILEVVFAFDGAPLGARDVRSAVRAAEPDADVTDLRGGQVLVRAPLRPADAAAQEAAVAELRQRFPAIDRASWAGDRLFVRARAPVRGAAVAAVLASHDLAGTVLRDYVDDLGDTQVVLRLAGQGDRIERAIEAAHDVDARIVRAEVVGPQRR